MLAFECEGRFFLVDCGADATREMVRAGLDPTEVAAIVLTHEHPDHISGFALLIEKLWLLGRRAPLPIFGPESALRVAEACFGVYTTDKWDGLPERIYHPVPPELGAPVFRDETFTVTAAPVEHPVPTIGLRVEAGGRTVAYSADTAQHDNVARLAAGADVLHREPAGGPCLSGGGGRDRARCRRLAPGARPRPARRHGRRAERGPRRLPRDGVGGGRPAHSRLRPPASSASARLVGATGRSRGPAR